MSSSHLNTVASDDSVSLMHHHSYPPQAFANAISDGTSFQKLQKLYLDRQYYTNTYNIHIHIHIHIHRHRHLHLLLLLLLLLHLHLHLHLLICILILILILLLYPYP